MGEQAVDILLKGIGAIEESKPLPVEFDHGVLITLRDAGKIIDRGIQNVNLNSHSPFGVRKAQYSKPVREQVITKINRFEQSFATIEGRITSVDAKEDRLRCRIEPSFGEPTLCQFDEQMAEKILSLVRKFVQARGEANYDVVTGKITMLYIKDLELVEESLGGGTSSPVSSFWKNVKFDELASQQGIYPVSDLKVIMGGWPEDEDIDAFLASIRS